MKLSDYLEKQEVTELMRRSDWRAWWSVGVNWGLLAGAFALAIAWPHPLTILVATLIIGGRQLGLGILVHDCAHNAFFKRRRTNEVVGHWLAGVPIDLSLSQYRTYHMAHHRHAGTSDDPDLPFVVNYPVTKASLRRKLTRDITGRTGFRDLARRMARFEIKKQWPWLAFHVALLGVLTAVGAWWAYALWWAAEMFVYPVIVRLRQIGEHGVVPDRGDSDPRNNTSTTTVCWWERLLVAPNHVNYHVEHHLASGVPSYRLAKMHRLLRTCGFYDSHDALSFGYADVLRRATRNPSDHVPRRLK